MFAIFLFAVSLFTYLYWRWGRRRMMELAATVPGWDHPLPFVGHAHRFIGDNANLLKQMISIGEVANQHKGLAKAWLGPKLYYAITDPEDAETLLNTCMDKDYFYKFGTPWVGEGLITADLPTWKRHHKKLSPAFNQNVLNGFIPVFNKQASIMVKFMEKELDGNWFDLYPYIGTATLETICQTAMGTPMGQETIADPPYLEAIHKILNVLTMRATKIWLHPQFIYDLLGYKKVEEDALKILHHVSTTVVRKKRAEFNENQKNSEIDTVDETETRKERPFRAFLDLMLELTSKEGAFTDQEIREEVDTMIGAGQESTGYGMTLTLLILGSHQAVQQKVYEELDQIFGKSDRDVTKEDLTNLVYLDAVIKEAFRVFPVVPIIIRYVDRELKLKHYTLPKGSSCAVSAWGIQHHPRWGPDFDVFRPERWFEPDSVPKHPAAFAAFSYGRRICIGKTYAMMSMKTMLAHVLRRYRVTSDISKLKLKLDVLMKPVAGNLVTIERRY